MTAIVSLPLGPITTDHDAQRAMVIRSLLLQPDKPAKDTQEKR